MNQQQWHEEFARVEERIQQNLEKLREHNEQMAEVIRHAERRREHGAPRE